MPNKIVWIDTETGGVNPETDALLQTAMIVSVNGEDKESHILYSMAFPGDNIDPEAMEVNKLFEIKDMSEFEDPKVVHRKIVKILEKYVNRYDPLDKFVFAGYGARFDMDFVRSFFRKAGDNYFGSYFYSLPLDVMSFVAEGIILGTVKPMKNFKLVSVCEQLGIKLGEDAHDAMADIQATRELYENLINSEYL